MTVITYLVKLQDNEDKDEAFDQASWATGSSSEKTYFIANYTHAKDKQSNAVDRAALNILDSVLLSAERFIRIRKQREKNKMEREITVEGNDMYILSLPCLRKIWQNEMDYSSVRLYEQN